MDPLKVSSFIESLLKPLPFCVFESKSKVVFAWNVYWLQKVAFPNDEVILELFQAVLASTCSELYSIFYSSVLVF